MFDVRRYLAWAQHSPELSSRLSGTSLPALSNIGALRASEVSRVSQEIQQTLKSGVEAGGNAAPQQSDCGAGDFAID